VDERARDEHVEERPPLGGETDAGPRPGAHPEVKRSGVSRSTVIGLLVVLVVAALMYAAIALGIVGSG
jgi:hypothetical protein